MQEMLFAFRNRAVVGTSVICKNFSRLCAQCATHNY